MSREDEIRERVSKATKGPWTFDSWRIFDGDEVEIFNTENILEHGDVAFIAHAREDVPYLLDLVATLRREATLDLRIDNPQLQDMDKAYQEICSNNQWSSAAERLKNIAKSAIRENATLRERVRELDGEASRLWIRSEELEEHIGKTADGVCFMDVNKNYCPHCNEKVRGDSFTAYCDNCVNPDGGAWPHEPPLPMFWEDTLSQPKVEDTE